MNSFSQHPEQEAILNCSDYLRNTIFNQLTGDSVCSLHAAGLVIQISFTAYARLFAQYNHYSVFHLDCYDHLATRALDADSTYSVHPHIKKPVTTARTLGCDLSLSLIHTILPSSSLTVRTAIVHVVVWRFTASSCPAGNGLFSSL